MRSEYSHAVPLPPFRSHSSAIERLQQQEALSFLNQAVLGNNSHNLFYAGVHERCHDVVERYAARTMLPVTRYSKADDHSQRLQGWRSCVHIVPDVSCVFSCHERALDTTVLHVVNEPAANHLGAKTQCCSRDHEQRILRAQRAELSFSALCHHSIVELFVGLLAVHKRPRHQLIHTRRCVIFSQAFSGGSAPPSLLATQRLHLSRFRQVYQPGSSAFHGARRRRHPGLPARIPRGSIIVFCRLTCAAHGSSAFISTSGASSGLASAFLVAPVLVASSR